jgi:hypothetical protein
MLQFPTSPPSGDVPPMSAFEQLVTCFLIVTMAAFFLFSMLLPRPWFEWVFKTAQPFMPDKLEDFDDR